MILCFCHSARRWGRLETLSQALCLVEQHRQNIHEQGALRIPLAARQAFSVPGGSYVPRLREAAARNLSWTVAPCRQHSWLRAGGRGGTSPLPSTPRCGGRRCIKRRHQCPVEQGLRTASGTGERGWEEASGHYPTSAVSRSRLQILLHGIAEGSSPRASFRYTSRNLSGQSMLRNRFQVGLRKNYTLLANEQSPQQQPRRQGRTWDPHRTAGRSRPSGSQTDTGSVREQPGFHPDYTGPSKGSDPGSSRGKPGNYAGAKMHSCNIITYVKCILHQLETSRFIFSFCFRDLGKCNGIAVYRRRTLSSSR